MATAAEELLGTLSAIRRALRRYSGRPVELSSLTGAQLELVRLLRRRPGASIADAALELRVAPNTVSTLVRQLSEAGVVARAVDGADRRVARLTIAPAISRKVDAWRDRRFEALGAALASLHRDDRDRLADALPALARLAEALEAAGAGG
jgi:DNA-binding MarR family transcriptional regulator